MILQYIYYQSRDKYNAISHFHTNAMIAFRNSISKYFKYFKEHIYYIHLWDYILDFKILILCSSPSSLTLKFNRSRRQHLDLQKKTNHSEFKMYHKLILPFEVVNIALLKIISQYHHINSAVLQFETVKKTKNILIVQKRCVLGVCGTQSGTIGFHGDPKKRWFLLNVSFISKKYICWQMFS